MMSGCDNFRGTEIPENMLNVNVSLHDQFGKEFSLVEQKGKVTLMFFGFTYCPDACPTMLSKWKQVEEILGEKEKQVRFVYVTVDPERDSPERMRDHLKLFSPNFIGLTGSEKELNTVYAGLGVYREKNELENSAAGYLYSHTSQIFVFDREGNWRLLLPYEATVQDIVHDIRLLL